MWALTWLVKLKLAFLKMIHATLPSLPTLSATTSVTAQGVVLTSLSLLPLKTSGQ